MGKMTFNIDKLKSYFFLSIVTLSLSVSAIRVQAAEQMQEPEVGQMQEEQGDSVATGVEISTTTMMYAVKKVNVRKEPNTSSGILGELELGDNIFAVELTDEGWYRVVYAGETGYIRGDFLAVFGDVDEWAASEPEPEPIEEPDITEITEDDKDALEADNGEEIEETESKEEESDNAAKQEEKPAGKVNIFTILIILILIIVIFVYAAIQIVNDYKNPDEGQEDNDEDESYEDDEWDDEDESYEDDEWDDDEHESDKDNDWEDEESENNEMWENDNESCEDKESENNDSEDDMDLDITDLDDE